MNDMMLLSRRIPMLAIVTFSLLAALLLFPASSAMAEQPPVLRGLNGWLYHKIPYSMNQALGVQGRLEVRGDDLEFDSLGRVIKMTVFNVDTGETIGRYAVTYDGDKAILNNVAIANLEYIGTGSGVNATKPGGEVVQEEVTKQATRTTSRLVGTRVASILAPRPKGPLKPVAAMRYGIDSNQVATARRTDQPVKGMAAGDAPLRWGVWANGAISKVDNYERDSRYNGSIYTTLLGADYTIFDALVIGAALGFEHAALNTEFNDGLLSTAGGSFSPYIGWAITDTLTLDIMGNFTFTGNHAKRDLTLFEYRSNYNSFRSMCSTNLTWYHLLEHWNFSAKAGFMYANEYSESYIERSSYGLRAEIGDRNAYLGEWSFGGRIGYFFDNVEPYVSLTWLWDPWMPNARTLDQDELEATLGLNIAATDRLTFSTELTNTFFRKFVNSTSLMCNARYEF